MFKPKLAVIGAAAGFTLSVIAGLLGGNPFGVVLFRALLMGILFSGLVAVLGAVVVKFLPELENPVSVEPAETGGMVDITLGDQNERLDPFAQGSGDGAGEEEQVPDFLMQGRSDHTEAPAEAFRPSSGEGIGSPEERGASPMPMPRPQAHHGTHAGSSSGGLDVLPDLDDFVPAKKAADSDEETPEGFNAASILSGSLPSSGGSSGGENDSETMAKAIRTILTREP